MPPRWKRHAPWVVLCGLVFFAVRLWYWSLTDETPFSDMDDFLVVGRNVWQSWTFHDHGFWQTYKPPTLPLMLAGTFTVFGEDLDAWRVCLAVFVFAGALCAAWSLARATGRAWIGYAMLAVVTLSRPSVFWSYKVASESVAEGFAYWCIAASLAVLRAPNLWKLAGLGALFTAATLNRPQVAITIPVFAILFFVLSPRAGAASRWRTGLAWATAFCFGSLLLWSPWLIRSYRLYGHVVPLTTQGPYSFLWELGDVTAEIDGETVTTNANELHLSAPRRFANDWEAQSYGGRFVRAWLSQNLSRYPGIVLYRFVRTLTDRTIYLTKVSRRELLPGLANQLLVDKKPWLLLAGMLGLLALGLFVAGTWAVFPIAVAPWFFGLLFLGYPRIVEPAIPLLVFGNVIVAWGLFAAVRSPQKALLGLYAAINRTGLLERPLGKRIFAWSYRLYKRHWEDPFYNLTRKEPQLFKGGHVLDVGANIGYTATTFARALDAGRRVFAFEPEPRNFAKLEDVSRADDRVVAVRAAVGDHEAEVELQVNEAHHGDHRVVTEASARNGRTCRVPMVTIDGYRARLPDEPISFVKIDVQGFEAKVLAGMSHTLAANPQAAVAFEYAPADAAQLGLDAEDVVSFFVTRGYDLAVIPRNGEPIPVASDDIRKHLGKRGYVDVLARPRAGRAQ